MEMSDIEKQIPARVSQADDLLCLGNTDDIISVLRYFEWNQHKLEDEWFADQDKLRVKVGLDYDD